MDRIGAELFDSMPNGPVFCTFTRYEVTFGSLPEVASDIITSMAIENVDLDVRSAHRVSKNERTTIK